MKTIICNNCVGARLYEIKGIQFNNPFMWSLIWYDDFKKIILDLKDINYQKFSFNNDDGISKIIIDDTIEVKYIHYKQDERYDKPTKLETNSLDIHYKDIKEYCCEKYIKRLQRMTFDSEFVFILVDDKKLSMTDDDINDFLNIPIPYQRICVTPRTYIKSKTTPILYTNETNTKAVAKLILDKKLVEI